MEQTKTCQNLADWTMLTYIYPTPPNPGNFSGLWVNLGYDGQWKVNPGFRKEKVYDICIRIYLSIFVLLFTVMKSRFSIWASRGVLCGVLGMVLYLVCPPVFWTCGASYSQSVLLLAPYFGNSRYGGYTVRVRRTHVLYPYLTHLLYPYRTRAVPVPSVPYPLCAPTIRPRTPIVPKFGVCGDPIEQNA